MIPFSFAGMVILALITFLGNLSFIGLLYMGIRAWHSPEYRLKFKSRGIAFKIWVAILLLFAGWGLFLQIMDIKIRHEVEREAANKLARQNVTLTAPHPYGELMLPVGTKIKQYDLFDNGEDNRPFRLAGVERIYFPKPFQMAGIWASAWDYPRIYLAFDQKIKGENCKKGDAVLYDEPMDDSSFDIDKESREADATARFKPSLWILKECQLGRTMPNP